MGGSVNLRKGPFISPIVFEMGFLWTAPIASWSTIAMASSRLWWTRPFSRCRFRC